MNLPKILIFFLTSYFPPKFAAGLTRFVAGLLLTSVFFLFPSSFLLAKILPKAPAFSQKDLKGQMQTLERYKGAPLVMYFWATWCPACLADAGALQEVYKKYAPDGVQFLGVSLDVDRSKLERYLQEKGVDYPTLFDGKGWENEMAQLYNVYSTPTFFLITPKGEIAAVGSWAKELERELGKL